LRVFIVYIFAAGLLAQQQGPRGVLRGELVELRAAAKSSGDFDFLASAGVIYRCAFDAHTYLERDSQRIGAAAIRAGDKLEIIADHKYAPGSCYARTIRVADNRPVVVNPGYRINLRPHRTTVEQMFPRGNLTFAGVVLRMNPELLVLRTRQDGEKHVLLRQDTRYMDSGLPSDLPRLAVNTRVFIRAGRNLENDLEAFQVIWGEIPGPKTQ